MIWKMMAAIVRLRRQDTGSMGEETGTGRECGRWEGGSRLVIRGGELDILLEGGGLMGRFGTTGRCVLQTQIRQ